MSGSTQQLQGKQLMSKKPEEIFNLTSSIRQKKCDLFVKVLKEDFLQELMYLWDVANRRAAPRDTMVQKILTPLTGIIAIVPIAGEGLRVAAAVGHFALAHLRDRRIETVAGLTEELDTAQLTILLDKVAREACRRYEDFIVNRLNDDPHLSVIPFAKAGARRMLQYIFQQVRSGKTDKEIVFNETLLLNGLIEGNSGNWIEGFSNHVLTLKQEEKKWFGKKHIKTIDAELVYGCAGFRHLEILNGKLSDEIYIREKPKKSGSHFGYVQFTQQKGKQYNPKAGYTIMPVEIIKGQYDFVQQSPKAISEDLRRDLRSFQRSSIQIDRATIEKYLQESKSSSLSLLDYVRKIARNPGLQRVLCWSDLSDLKLSGKNLSHGDYSGAIFTGDLSKTDLSHSYLVGAIFDRVTSARQIKLYHSHCEYLQAIGVDFQEGDFNSAYFSYAQLNRANLRGCKTIGVHWDYTGLDGVQSDTDLLNEQKKLIQQLQKSSLLQQQRTRELYKILQVQSQRINELSQTWIKKTSIVVDNKAVTKLTQQVQSLQQQQEARLTFEAQYQERIKELEQQLSSVTEKNGLLLIQTQLEETQRQLKSLQEAKGFQQALEIFQADCGEELKKMTGNLSGLQRELSELQTSLFKEHKEQYQKQNQRLDALENQFQIFSDTLLNRFRVVENRVAELEQWAVEAKTIFKIVNDEKSVMQQNISTFHTALQKLSTEQIQLVAAQFNHEARFVQLQSQIAQTAQAEEVGFLREELQRLEAKLSTQILPVTPEVDTAILALQSELNRQKTAFTKTIQINAALKSKLQGNIDHVTQQLEQLQQLQENFKQKCQARLENHEVLIKGLQQSLQQAYSACDARIKELEMRVAAIEDWAEQTQQRLDTYESEQQEVQLQVKALQVELSKLLNQQQEQELKYQNCQQSIIDLQGDIQHSQSAQQLQEYKTQLSVMTEHLAGLPKAIPPSGVSAQLQNMVRIYSEQKATITETMSLTDGEVRGMLQATCKEIGDKINYFEQLVIEFAKQQQAQQAINELAIQAMQHNLTQVQAALAQRVSQLEVRMDQAEAAIHSSDPNYTVAMRLMTLRQKILEDKFITEELSYYIAPNGQRQPGSESTTPLKPWVERNFLQSAAQVLLLQAPGGAGKSTFSRHLLRDLWRNSAWETFKPGNAVPEVYVPLFIPLGSTKVDPRHFFDYLRDLPELIEDFTDAEINVLKTKYHILWIADGYDEIPGNLKINLYEANNLGAKQYGGRHKLLISRRNEPPLTPLDEKTYFMPQKASGVGDESAYLSFYVAPFSDEQMTDYIRQYLDKNQQRSDLTLWATPQDYLKHFAELSELRDMISTPFLLMIAIEVLPVIVANLTLKQESPAQDSKMIKQTLKDLKRAALYDGFMENWFTREAKKTLLTQNYLEEPEALLGEAVVQEVEEAARGNSSLDVNLCLLKKGYLMFCQEFSRHLQEDKMVSVQYPPEEKRVGRLGGSPTAVSASPTWVNELFDEKDRDMARCRRGSPLRTVALRNKRYEFGFIHSSMINYFVSTLIYQPKKTSLSTNLSVAMLGQASSSSNFSVSSSASVAAAFK